MPVATVPARRIRENAHSEGRALESVSDCEETEPATDTVRWDKDGAAMVSRFA